jgi:short-subunit dehydrogenase
MRLEGTRIVLTGAAGGIGRATALALARAGARLALVARSRAALAPLAAELRALGSEAVTIGADLTRAADRAALLAQAHAALGGIDVLVNNAGVLNFNDFVAEPEAATERLFAVNVLAPMALARALLPALRAQAAGRIVNVGSTFGSIAFPYFAAYSASKFALRGFSEALRRELDGSGVGVTYVAPRATRTALNPGAVERMNAALKVAMDPPEVVAAAIVAALRADRAEVYLGWPERLFVRLNALLPRLVDGAVRKQRPVMQRFVAGTEAGAGANIAAPEV